MTLSREVRAIVAYIESTGLAHRVTSTTGGVHSPTSRHYRRGTGGMGLAVDLAGPRPGDVHAMSAICEALLERAGDLHELIYSGPGIDRLVYRRRLVAPAHYGTKVLRAHRNHVHVSVDRGSFLAPVPPPPTRSVAIAAGPVGPVHDWEGPVKTTMVVINLDDDGNGWVDWPAPFPGRDPVPVAVVALGPSPPHDGYWPEFARATFAAQPRDGNLRVTARGGPPGGVAQCWATCA
jgi:hypothetical protein